MARNTALSHFDADRQWQNWDNIIRILGFADMKELHQWMVGPLFRPYRVELYNDYYAPERARLGPQGSVPLPTRLQAHARIVEEEIYGQKRFSRYTSDQPLDKSNWTAVDHFALFLYRATEANQTAPDGLYEGRSQDVDGHYAKM